MWNGEDNFFQSRRGKRRAVRQCEFANDHKSCGTCGSTCCNPSSRTLGFSGCVSWWGSSSGTLWSPLWSPSRSSLDLFWKFSEVMPASVGRLASLPQSEPTSESHFVFRLSWFGSFRWDAAPQNHLQKTLRFQLLDWSRASFQSCLTAGLLNQSKFIRALFQVHSKLWTTRH